MAKAYNSSTITSSTGTVELGILSSKNNSTVVVFSGTYSGFTVNFEGTNDGSTWFKLPTVRASSGVLEVGAVTLVDNSTVGFILANGVFGKVRVRASARTSGTLAVAMSASESDIDAVVGNHKFTAENIGKKTVSAAAGSGTASQVLVATGPGILHKLSVTTAGGTASLVLYDNASAASGTKLYTSPVTHAIGLYDINLAFANGITAYTPATTAVFTAVYSLS